MTEQPTSFVRVTVVGAGGEADLALPTGRTIAELSLLVDHFVPGGDTPRHLVRVGQPPMAHDRTLGDYRVRHGEVLHLVPSADVPPPAVVDDPVEVVERETTAVGGRWTSATVHTTLVGFGGALLAVGAVTLWAAGVRGAGFAAAAAVATASALALRIMASARLAAVVAWAAVPFWAFLGALTAPAPGVVRTVGIGLAVVAGVVVAGAIAPVSAPLATGLAAVATTAAGVGGGIHLLGATLAQAAGVAAVVWLLALALVPGATITATGLLASVTDPPADQRPDRTTVRVRRARWFVLATTVAGAGSIAAGSAALALAGDGYGVGLGATLVVLAALRMRRFASAAERWSLLAAAGTGVSALLIRATLEAATDLLITAAALAPVLAGAGLLALSHRVGRRAPSPRTAARLDRLETVAALAVAPLLAGLLGLYTWAETFARSL